MQAELCQSGDLGQDGVGLIFLCQCVAVGQIEVHKLQQLKAFGDCEESETE